jgi:hypothetical protein
MRTALLLIATGPRYWPYILPLIKSAQKFFVPHDVILFTDSPTNYGFQIVYLPAQGYPETTLKRYHTFLDYVHLLDKYDYVFFVDIDAVFVDYVGPEIFADGITATLHRNQNPFDLLETRPHSTAYLAKMKEYYCGGFNGGTVEAYFEMAEHIRTAVDLDTKRGIVAIWHDESHMNRYLSEHPPAKVLTSDYCYPETELHKPCHPKIVCLEKARRDGVDHYSNLQQS